MTRTTTFLMTPTESSPFVEFDYSLGKLDIIGKKVPESHPEFYKQLQDKVNEYLADKELPLNVNISLEEMDFSSNDQFKHLLNTIKRYQEVNSNVLIKLYYSEFDDQQIESLQSHIDSLGLDCSLRSYGF